MRCAHVECATQLTETNRVMTSRACAARAGDVKNGALRSPPAASALAAPHTRKHSARAPTS